MRESVDTLGGHQYYSRTFCDGALAQLGERNTGSVEVNGSIPLGSTRFSKRIVLVSPSSRGLGHRPFTAVTGVRIPLGIPFTLFWEEL